MDAEQEQLLVRDALRDARRSLIWLAGIWLPTLAYVVLVLANDSVQGHWRFAQAVPAVLIALFASGFVYGGIVLGVLARRGRLERLARLRAQGW